MDSANDVITKIWHYQSFEGVICIFSFSNAIFHVLTLGFCCSFFFFVFFAFIHARIDSLRNVFFCECINSSLTNEPITLFASKQTILWHKRYSPFQFIALFYHKLSINCDPIYAAVWMKQKVFISIDGWFSSK